MQNLDGLVINYLTMSSNHALMISGPWGSGKTYYLENVLRNQIEATPCFNDNGQKYKLIRVSMFGLKSIEEVQVAILMKIFNGIDGLGLELYKELALVFMKGFIILKGGKDFLPLIPKPNVLKIRRKSFESKKLDDIVICLDDLERINPGLGLSEIFGFINTLVETKRAKIIILANTGKGALGINEFNDLREKVIGRELPFQLDVSSCFESIVKTHFGSALKYKDYLLSQRAIVEDLFFRNTNNLRALIFVLQKFQLIFTEIELNFLGDKFLVKNKDEILKHLFCFSLAVGLEHWEGSLASNGNKMPSMAELAWHKYNTTRLNDTKSIDGGINEKSWLLNLINRYFLKYEYSYFNTLFVYLTEKESFVYDKFREELNFIYRIDGDDVPEYYKVYNQLSYSKCFELTNGEYAGLAKKLKAWALKGVFKLSDYPRVFQMLTAFSNFLDYDIMKLEEEILVAMINGHRNSKYDVAIANAMEVPEDAEFKDSILKIVRAAVDLNLNLKDMEIKRVSNELEDLLYVDHQRFVEAVLDNNRKNHLEAIFQNFDARKFLEFYLNSKPQDRILLNDFFDKRYANHRGDLFVLDLPFLRDLFAYAQDCRKQNVIVGVEGYMFNRFKSKLERIIAQLESAS